jgi:hypothetical protein
LALVRAKGARISRARTLEETNVGLFWAYDGARLLGTPPRLYNQLLSAIAQRDGLDTIQLARLLAVCNLAMADAGISCWEAKYKYAVWRPVVAIQMDPISPDPEWQPLGSPRTNRPDFALASEAHNTSFAQSMIAGDPRSREARSRAQFEAPQRSSCMTDAEYRMAAFTPNFPAYPSGHAAFGAACFTAMQSVRRSYGKPARIALTHLSDELNGVSIDNYDNQPRMKGLVRFDSVRQMIEENGLSRVFLGVHWKFDTEFGSRSGELIGDIVANRAYA